MNEDKGLIITRLNTSTPINYFMRVVFSEIFREGEFKGS